MRDTHRLFLAPLVLAGCVEQIYNESIGQFPPTADGASSTTEAPSPTTTEGAVSSPVATVTGPPDETTSTTSTTTEEPETTTGTPAENQPPTIELFAASPEHVSEAGQIKLELAASDDVAVVQVRLELDGEKIADLKPADFPYFFDVLSAKYNGAQRRFKVVALDAENLSAAAEVKVGMELPSPGAEKCHFEDKGANLSFISALKYTRDGIVAVGSRDTGAGLRLTAWKLSPDCELLAGWPRSIVHWTAKPALAAMTSHGAAVDVDEAGNIIVAGNFVAGGKPQSYVARLNPDGARLWEKEGQPGDEVAGVAAATAQFKNRVFVVGSQRTSDNPVRTDGAIWVYFADGESVFIQPPVLLRAPFTPDEFDLDPQNARSEKVHAVVIQPGTGNALAVGEREYKFEGVSEHSAAFSVVVHPLGGVVGTPWTSEAPAFLHDALRSVTLCGDKVLAGGWTRDEPPDAKPQPIIFWPGTDQHRHLPQLSTIQIHGIACDREAKIVSAGTRSLGSPDAQVFTVTGLFDPPTWYEAGVAGDDAAGAVACDWRGLCGWGGYRSANGMMYAFVRVHHP